MPRVSASGFVINIICLRCVDAAWYATAALGAVEANTHYRLQTVADAQSICSDFYTLQSSAVTAGPLSVIHACSTFDQ